MRRVGRIGVKGVGSRRCFSIKNNKRDYHGSGILENHQAMMQENEPMLELMQRKRRILEVNTPHDRVQKFVLTGGPCGGKTSSLMALQQRLKLMGYKVYCVPEAATILFSGGGRFENWDQSRQVAFEVNKMKTQMALEDAFMNLASLCETKSVVICDRGTLDSSAYVNKETWDLILNSQQWTSKNLNEDRYDAVVHIVTAADGAEQSYSKESNKVRTETVEQAKEIDERLLNAWRCHPKFFKVDNSTDFSGKMERVSDIVVREIVEACRRS
eukprot:TRINITY_DN6192_c0_g1_i1.p1 TRINITY_DN6192_c0_g1~~TRINITY_DN6192_c0_g1_i1.p1  ORF type:complete len:271 (+),score=68.88 TRINITY_DN6192_c0_g1_i1:99-911(+)